MMFSKQFVIGSIVLLGVVGGCGSNKPPTTTEFFPYDETSYTKTQRIMDIQVRAGALNDPTLHDYHFEGAKLNSLGVEKLVLIAPTTEDARVTVYLDLKNDDLFQARRDAVSSLLMAEGMKSTNIALAAGTYPGASNTAAAGLKQLQDADAVDVAGAAASTTSGIK
jgi:hypothetical protein